MPKKPTVIAEPPRAGKMAKQGAAEKSRSQKGPKSEKENKIKSKSKQKKKIQDDAKKIQAEVAIVPSSSTESQNDVVEGSSGEEENGIVEERKEKRKRENTKNGKKEVKNKGKKKIRGEEAEELKGETTTLYKFPMNRISRIIKSEDSDVRISQEAVFLINRASEKFLELFAKEAYACAVMDRKKQIGYNHLSSVVSKRTRFDFLSDFVPEKLKAEDALKQMSMAE